MATPLVDAFGVQFLDTVRFYARSAPVETEEYLKSLRERHKMQLITTKRGNVVLIKGDERNRRKWKIGIIGSFIVGKDGVVRGVHLRAGKSHLEYPMQRSFAMALSCDWNETEDNKPIVVQQEQIEKPKRAPASQCKTTCKVSCRRLK